jgi:hypothetical protein
VRIDVTPGDVQVASVQVRRHSGGIYTIQISTPHNKRVGLAFGSVTELEYVAGYGQSLPTKRVQVFLFPEGPGWSMPTKVILTHSSTDEEEALMHGLFDVLDDWSRYSVTLIAIPASVLEEAEEPGSWEPQGPVDYLATS